MPFLLKHTTSNNKFLLSTAYVKKHEAGIGETVVFTCKYRNYGIWSFENRSLPLNVKVKLAKSGKCVSNTLTIPSVQPHNAGTYECQFWSIFILEVYGKLLMLYARNHQVFKSWQDECRGLASSLECGGL